MIDACPMPHPLLDGLGVSTLGDGQSNSRVAEVVPAATRAARQNDEPSSRSARRSSSVRWVAASVDERQSVRAGLSPLGELFFEHRAEEGREVDGPLAGRRLGVAEAEEATVDFDDLLVNGDGPA